jgi:HCOMODA/2-hydroxy-3-carboxy-muconic semialdehyde decarboxylase
MTTPIAALPTEGQQTHVRIAARALARANLVHAYGHCSMRLNESHFLVCAPQAMGLIVAGEAGIVVPVQGELPEGTLGEVRIHQEIYQRRPEIGGIVRSMPRDVMTLSTARITPAPRHGMGSYFSPGVPLWDDPQLVRTQAQAAGVAACLADRAAVVMRGNGAVVVAPTLTQAVVLTWYLEDAARIELAMHSAGLVERGAVLTEQEAAQRAVGTGRIYERMWDYLVAGDIEAGNTL